MVGDPCIIKLIASELVTSIKNETEGTLHDAVRHHIRQLCVALKLDIAMAIIGR